MKEKKVILPLLVLQGLVHDGTLYEAFLNANRQQTFAAFLVFYKRKELALHSDTNSIISHINFSFRALFPPYPVPLQL